MSKIMKRKITGGNLHRSNFKLDVTFYKILNTYMYLFYIFFLHVMAYSIKSIELFLHLFISVLVLYCLGHKW